MSSGLPAVQQTCAELGLVFDPWQADTAKCILAKDEFGQYAADTVVLSIARQVGKTWLIGALVFADSIVNPGTLTVWTAHRFKIARETFTELWGIAQLPELLPHVDPAGITTAAGNEQIRFRNGSRIMFAARERGSVRGAKKVRRLILDEAQILTDSALEDLAPTQNQAVNPQIIFMGTPPKPSDPAEVFLQLRAEALSGESVGTFYLELGAPLGSDIDDRDAWRIANPSYPARTPAKAILRLRKLFTEDGFAREALGIWSPGAQSVINPEVWAALADRLPVPDRPPILDPVCFAVDVPPERGSATIGMAARRADGLPYVEVIPDDTANPDRKLPGTDWVVPRVLELVDRWKPCAVLIDRKAAGSLLDDLAAAGLTVVTVAGWDEKQSGQVVATGMADMEQACAGFYDAATAGNLRHQGQVKLATAVDQGRKRPLGDAWAWKRRDENADVSPLVAVTLALFGHAKFGRKMPTTFEAFGF